MALLRRRERRARVLAAVVFAALGMVFATALAHPAAPSVAPGVATSAERLAEARVAIAGARDNARAAQDAFDRGVRAAVGAGASARPDLGACPIELVASRPGVAGVRGFPMLVVERVEIGATMPSQSVAEVLADVRRAEAHVSAGRFEEASLYAHALARPERLRPEVVVVARASTKPKAMTGTAFVPGEIDARAYLYDFASRSVVCAADVHVTSSKAIGYAYAPEPDAPAAVTQGASLASAIDDDFRAQIARAVVDAMKWRAGGPR